MRGSIYKKGLVVGIIILFLGLSVQPIIGTEILEKKAVDMGKIDTIKNTEECKSCELELLFENIYSVEILREKFQNIINPNPPILYCQFLGIALFTVIYLKMIFMGMGADPLIEWANATLSQIWYKYDLYCIEDNDIY